MRVSKGFTLIELIVVIVIISILAVIAIPRFIDYSTDATLAKLKSMAGALDSGVKIVHSKALISNKLTSSYELLDVGNVTVELKYGYPSANWNSSVRYLVELDSVSFSNYTEICDLDWCGKGYEIALPSGVTIPSGGRAAKVFPRGYSFNDQCGVYFINNGDGTPGEIGLETSDC
jgi:prepilin-type N-terminal cleavage/methylation domain-containing protein